ncbi:MAG: hypothetical protein JRE64_02225 [Deltaproteobacteria bacterium]|nr:hypothetical protein [Deltaproteobacteria bacterium]
MLYDIDDIFQDGNNQIWRCVSYRRESIARIPGFIVLGDEIIGFRNILTDEYLEGTENQLPKFTKLNGHE